MKIDLAEIIKCEGEKLIFADKVAIAPLWLMGETVEFPNAVQIGGSVVNEGKIFRLIADVKGNMAVHCARCGKPMAKEFSFSMEETLMQEDARGSEEILDEDVTVFTGHELELDELVENNIFLNLPVKYLCKEDCKGLCPKCGKDLNEGGCECDHREIDPRLSMLSKFTDK